MICSTPFYPNTKARICSPECKKTNYKKNQKKTQQKIKERTRALDYLATLAQMHTSVKTLTTILTK